MRDKREFYAAARKESRKRERERKQPHASARPKVQKIEKDQKDERYRERWG